MNTKSKEKIQGIISRIGSIESASKSGIQFILENNNNFFCMEVTPYDKTSLTKIGDLVTFYTKKTSFFTNDFNVERKSFINLSLEKDLG